jgi:hypothetical protein
MNLPTEKINLINNLVTTGPGLLVKWFFVIGLAMYAFFALVVTRQVKIMTKTIESEVNIAVTMFAWVHFLLSVLLIVAAVVLL